MRAAVPWLVVGAVLGGAGAGAQEAPLAATDRVAMERTLAVIREVGNAWMSWLGEAITAEDYDRWSEPPPGFRPPRLDLSELPDPEDEEAVRAWAGGLVAEMEAKKAWQEGRRYKVDWPGYYDLAKLPVRLTAAELEEILRELLPAERVDGLVWEDGWGRPLELRFSGYLWAPQVMAIRSAGRDGEAEPTMYRVGLAPPDPDAEIVWADGFFLRWPDGVAIGE